MENWDPGQAAQAANDLHGWASALLLAWLLIAVIWLVVRAPKKLIVAMLIVFGPLAYAHRHELARSPASVVEAPVEQIGEDLAARLDS